VHMAPSWRLRQRKVEDGRVDATGYVRPYYPTFVVFNVLGHMVHSSHLSFYLSLYIGS
jgi:hypothetical protein